MSRASFVTEEPKSCAAVLLSKAGRAALLDASAPLHQESRALADCVPSTAVVARAKRD